MKATTDPDLKLGARAVGCIRSGTTSSFIQKDFLLDTPTARHLFHDVAEALPIIDYHCHLDARGLAENRQFKNLTELWIASDPYKHRAMRIAGMPESEITGPASDRVKFERWAETVPSLVGNSLHHWTALELKHYFGIEEPLNSQSAERIWNHCNSRLSFPEGAARALLQSCSVECVCTSDCLGDDLSHHATLKSSEFKVQVLPSLRSDDITAVDSPNYRMWAAQIGKLSGVSIDSWSSFAHAVRCRLDAFDHLGCRLADHALDDFSFVPIDETATAALWERLFNSTPLSAAEIHRLKSGLLRWLGHEYAQRNWVLQLHLGAQRFTSTRLRKLVGPAGGFAGMGNPTDLKALCSFLDDLEQHGLPKIILYSLNPTLNAPLATLTGSFVADGVRSLVQFGPAWWYNDHFSGINSHLDALSSHGSLATFIGMTTDSRSLLSMVRHEYFRRILCNWIGSRVESGFLPNDDSLLLTLVTDICHDNAAKWIFPKT